MHYRNNMQSLCWCFSTCKKPVTFDVNSHRTILSIEHRIRLKQHFTFYLHFLSPYHIPCIPGSLSLIWCCILFGWTWNSMRDVEVERLTSPLLLVDYWLPISRNVQRFLWVRCTLKTLPPSYHNALLSKYHLS